MQENPSPRSERGGSPQHEDDRAQRAVLDLVLNEHPTYLTIYELARELYSGEAFSENDAAERAIRDLVGTGLLRCHRALVLPTRAALHFDRLWP